MILMGVIIPSQPLLFKKCSCFDVSVSVCTLLDLSLDVIMSRDAVAWHVLVSNILCSHVSGVCFGRKGLRY